MAKYILLINWTEQGVKNVKDSPNAWTRPASWPKPRVPGWATST